MITYLEYFCIFCEYECNAGEMLMGSLQMFAYLCTFCAYLCTFKFACTSSGIFILVHISAYNAYLSTEKLRKYIFMHILKMHIYACLVLHFCAFLCILMHMVFLHICAYFGFAYFIIFMLVMHIYCIFHIFFFVYIPAYLVLHVAAYFVHISAYLNLNIMPYLPSCIFKHITHICMI